MTVQEAARAYFRNIQALRGGKVSADEHRAVNRQLREALGADGWERAKVIALSNDLRIYGA